MRAIAAQGPLSIEAHDGPLELLADQSVTVTATDDEIEILAKDRIVLQAGQSAITLDGIHIDFKCPGTFRVRASQHPFSGPARDAAALPALPLGESTLPTHTIELDHRYHDDAGLPGAKYVLKLSDGSVREGNLDADGKATISGVSSLGAHVSFGPAQNPLARKDKTPTPAHDPSPGDAKLRSTVDRYLSGQGPAVEGDAEQASADPREEP